jgi:hypothetical protein
VIIQLVLNRRKNECYLQNMGKVAGQPVSTRTYVASLITHNLCLVVGTAVMRSGGQNVAIAQRYLTPAYSHGPRSERSDVSNLTWPSFYFCRLNRSGCSIILIEENGFNLYIFLLPCLEIRQVL